MHSTRPLIVREQPAQYLISLVDQLFQQFDQDRDGALSLAEFNALEMAAGEVPSTPGNIELLCNVLGIPINPNGTMSKDSYTTLLATNIRVYPEKLKVCFRNLGFQVQASSFPPPPPQHVLQQFEQNIQQAVAMRYQQSIQNQAQMNSFMHNNAMNIISAFPGNQNCQCGARKNSNGVCPNCNRRN